MWQRCILLCKITSFQNENPFGGNRYEIIFFVAQKGLWGGRRGSVALFFQKKRGEIFLINKIVSRRQATADDKVGRM